MSPCCRFRAACPSACQIAGVRLLQPGLLVAAKPLLARNPDRTESEARYWPVGNLCRCTGCDKVIRAVLDAAAEMRAG
jgi:aerobic-type carbon monoxide dehydrogenase small subunit (CoxS/CutS family)